MIEEEVTKTSAHIGVLLIYRFNRKYRTNRTNLPTVTIVAVFKINKKTKYILVVKLVTYLGFLE